MSSFALVNQLPIPPLYKTNPAGTENYPQNMFGLSKRLKLCKIDKTCISFLTKINIALSNSFYRVVCTYTAQ